MDNLNKNEGWPEFELIPFGRRLDAVSKFLGRLCARHRYEPETGAESLLERLQDENISGFGYQDES